MPASLLKTAARAGKHACQITKAVPSMMLRSRQTSWMAFEQPNPWILPPPPVFFEEIEEMEPLQMCLPAASAPPPPSPSGGPGGPGGKKPDDDKSDTKAQQRLLDWLQFAAERIIGQRPTPTPYYVLPTTKVCIPGHPATFGCSPFARYDPRMETRPGEKVAPVRVWTYDYELERAITDEARAKAEEERVKAKEERLRRMYIEAVMREMQHD
ncbi:hypothetical protein PG996_011777 [Apiospora saccharicola]|uniref:Uncharacterized protein n=1 Tax=Apiospora saccharicola TaxID=335842 RepID=A0ABR1UG06_9PEZI